MASTRTVQRSFWKDLPPASVALLLGAVAATFASFGFLTDNHIARLGFPRRSRVQDRRHAPPLSRHAQ